MKTLYDWTREEIKNGPELLDDEIFVKSSKGATIRRDTRRLREISLGCVSSNNAKEFYNVCRLNCPPGTVIEEYNEEKWIPLYEDMTLLCRNKLTRLLLDERSNKSAKTLLEILTKRDKEHWAEEKTTKTAEIQKGDETIKFVFEGL